MNAGFSSDDLADAGFSATEIRAAEQVLPPGMTADSVKNTGCSVEALKRERLAGVSAALIRRHAGCSASALKAAGFAKSDLLNAGFNPAELNAISPLVNDNLVKAAGCDPNQLKGLLAQGVSAKRIHALNGCSAQALKDAGFDAKDLLEAGFSPQDLAAAGFTPHQINGATMSDAAVRRAGCDPTQLKALLVQGVSAKRIHQLNGCSAQALKDAGFDAKDLLNAGFTAQQLADAGFTPSQVSGAAISNDTIRGAGCDPNKLKTLVAQGVSAKRIHDVNGCSAQALKAAGFDAKDLLAAGFTPQELLQAGFTPNQLNAATIPDRAIQMAGCDPTKLKALQQQGVSAKRIHELNGCSAQALKTAGFGAKELMDAGFTAKQLLAAGFTPNDVSVAQAPDDATIRAAGCDPTKLHDLLNRGVTAKRIRGISGCNADALKSAGFDANALTDAGFTPQQLKTAGFSTQEINDALPLNDNLIRAAGCDPAQLQKLMTRGASAKRIHDLNGCSADVLKKAGYRASDLLAAGFTPKQLAAAGFSPADIAVIGSAVSDNAVRAAGCDPNQLQKLLLQGVTADRIRSLSGCKADALKAAGFSAKALADAGFTPAELLAAGFTPSQLIQANLNPAGVIAAGRTADCSAASLQAAHAMGVSAATIKKTLGCSAQAMKNAGFTPLELKNAGFTAAELRNAGFSANDLNKAGFGAKELRAAGFSAKELLDAGYNPKQLNDAGFSATELKNAGLTASQLKAAGYSSAALKAAGFSAAELLKAGVSAKELKEAGYSAEELRSAGLSNKELQAAGFSSEVAALAGLEGVDQPPPTPSVVTTIPSINGGVTPAQQMNADAANAKKLQTILDKQQKQAAEQRYQQKIQQRSSVMTSAANQAVQGWKAVPNQQYVATAAKDKDAGALDGRGGPLGLAQSTTATQQLDGPMKEAPAILRTGDVIFAVIDTSVNSDEPGPILATIVSGRLKGGKLIGSFNLPSNADKMIISFNTLSMPGAPKTVSISAFAIDPNTARTALSSQTDHHYLMRYGSLFAATFLEGFGNAFQSANTTITVGGTGGTTDTTVSNGIGRSTLENAVIGLATLGKAWGQVAMQQMSRPTTVEVFSGTGIGVLFTQDLRTL